MIIFRETILKTAKSLVEDTKTLVAGATSNQEQLATAAQSAVMTITRLSDCVKLGAGSLGSEQPDAQVNNSKSRIRRVSHMKILKNITIMSNIFSYYAKKINYMFLRYKNLYCISSICIKKLSIHHQLLVYFCNQLPQFLLVLVIGQILVHRLVAVLTKSRKFPKINQIHHFYMEKISKK